MPDYDERGPRLLTREHDGQPGEPFELWAKGFLDAATGKGDEDASWAATALDSVSLVLHRQRGSRRAW